MRPSKPASVVESLRRHRTEGDSSSGETFTAWSAISLKSLSTGISWDYFLVVVDPRAVIRSRFATMQEVARAGNHAKRADSLGLPVHQPSFCFVVICRKYGALKGGLDHPELLGSVSSLEKIFFK